MSDEEFVLEKLPSLDDLVSEANPEPWREWLPKQDGPRIAGEVAWYHHANCHWLVYKGRVLLALGCTGEVIFQELTESLETRNQFFRERARYLRTQHNLAEAVDGLANRLHVCMEQRMRDDWTTECPTEIGDYWIYGHSLKKPQLFQVLEVSTEDGGRIRARVSGSDPLPVPWFRIPGYWFQKVRVPEPPIVSEEPSLTQETGQ